MKNRAKEKTPLELFKGKTKLNLRAKKLWIEALKSGKFNQGKKRLCTINTPNTDPTNRSYCCLGVLCEVLIANKFPITPNIKAIQEKSWTAIAKGEEANPCVSYQYEESNTSFYFPSSVGKHIGLDDKKALKLAEMNDGNVSINNPVKPKTFKQIASYIKRYL